MPVEHAGIFRATRRRILGASAVLGAAALLPHPSAAIAATDQLSQVIALTNQQRQQAGLAPLASNASLMQAAGSYAGVLATSGCFAHTCGPVPDLAQRDQNAGYVGWTALGENIAAGYSTPDAVVAAWMASPEHRANILKPSYDEIGVGVASGGSMSAYWVQEFGARAVAPASVGSGTTLSTTNPSLPSQSSVPPAAPATSPPAPSATVSPPAQTPAPPNTTPPAAAPPIPSTPIASAPTAPVASPAPAQPAAPSVVTTTKTTMARTAPPPGKPASVQARAPLAKDHDDHPAALRPANRTVKAPAVVAPHPKKTHVAVAHSVKVTVAHHPAVPPACAVSRLAVLDHSAAKVHRAKERH